MKCETESSMWYELKFTSERHEQNTLFDMVKEYLFVNIIIACSNITGVI